MHSCQICCRMYLMIMECMLHFIRASPVSLELTFLLYFWAKISRSTMCHIQLQDLFVPPFPRHVNLCVCVINGVVRHCTKAGHTCLETGKKKIYSCQFTLSCPHANNLMPRIGNNTLHCSSRSFLIES